MVLSSLFATGRRHWTWLRGVSERLCQFSREARLHRANFEKLKGLAPHPVLLSVPRHRPPCDTTCSLGCWCNRFLIVRLPLLLSRQLLLLLLLHPQNAMHGEGVSTDIYIPQLFGSGTRVLVPGFPLALQGYFLRKSTYLGEF
jgi:hypothetical protein